MALSLSVAAFADGDQATITTVPSPAISTKALEVKITTSDLGNEVYCYTWCADVNGKEISPWKWGDVHTDKFRMSGSGGTYTLKINNIQEFYGLNDTQIQGLKKLGFIAKNSGGGQTADCFVDIEQGPREAYGGGYGTQESPYILNTSAHLVDFSNSSRDWKEDVYVKLGSDIEGVVLLSSIGSTGSPYKGHFDGNGHTINGINLASNTLGTSVGLFGAIENAEIKKLGVTNANIEGVNNVGVLAGTAISGKIDRCFVTGTVKGKSICVGGLVGENIGATITDCYAGVAVENGDDYATGGLVGKNRGTIKNVYATGAIKGKDYVGGISGANYGRISNSVAMNVSVKGNHSYTARFGGNNNTENQGGSNHSWDNISNSASWSAHGDHATAKPASDLVNYATFKSLSNWDFDSVWEWKEENGKAFPVLRNLANQTNVIPAELFAQSGVEEIIEASGVNITAGPTPFTDTILVSCTEGLGSVGVYSVSGQCVASVQNPGSAEISVDMSGASAGIYIVSVISESGSKSTFKLIKK